MDHRSQKIIVPWPRHAYVYTPDWWLVSESSVHWGTYHPPTEIHTCMLMSRTAYLTLVMLPRVSPTYCDGSTCLSPLAIQRHSTGLRIIHYILLTHLLVLWGHSVSLSPPVIPRYVRLARSPVSNLSISVSNALAPVSPLGLKSSKRGCNVYPNMDGLSTILTRPSGHDILRQLQDSSDMYVFQELQKIIIALTNPYKELRHCETRLQSTRKRTPRRNSYRKVNLGLLDWTFGQLSDRGGATADRYMQRIIREYKFILKERYSPYWCHWGPKPGVRAVKVSTDSIHWMGRGVRLNM